MNASFILRVMRWLNKYYLSLIKNDPHTNPEGFEGLTPFIQKNAELNYSDISTKALEKALNDPAINNIAVTGSFGAGKSSFLRTFEKHHSWWDYIVISLATFTDGEHEKGKTNQVIEKSILQQLLYKVKKETIPQSQFNKIRKIYFFKSLVPIVLLLIWLGTYTIIFQRETAKNILNFQSINIPELCYLLIGEDICNYAVLVLFTVTTFILTWQAYKYFSNFRVTKFTSKGDVDITTLPETSEESFLNKNLDEIMYFFEVSPYNVVVIEDLDRSKNSEIFIKLREINELINKSDQIKKPVKFIYALKDEIFTDEERTKFFDFIIPIIPIINRSNSYPILSKKLSEFKEDQGFQTLLKEVSQYIEDMRLLINIVNEFKIYNEKINPKIERKKVFSMIVYKNMFPADFSALHKNRGVLCEIFDSKNSYIQESVKLFDREVDELQEEISELQNRTDWLNDLKELRSIYIQRLMMKYKLNHDASIKDEERNRLLIADGIDSEDIFESIRGSNTIYHTIPKTKDGYSYSHHVEEQEVSFDFSLIDTTSGDQSEYDLRKARIEGKYDDEIQALKEKINTINNKKRKLYQDNVEELLRVESINVLFIEKSSELNKNANNNVLLLRHFIRNGYIDEQYLDCVSFFHVNEEVSLSLRDYETLLQIRDQKPLPFTHPIQRPAEIINELQYRIFENDSVLNFDLIEELLVNHQNYSVQKKSFIKLVSSDSTQVSKFIEEFFEFTQNKDVFIKLLVQEKKNLLEFIQNNKNFSDKKKDIYLAEIIKSCEVEEILKLNEDDCLKELIENKVNFIEFEQEHNLTTNLYRNKTETLLSDLNIKFEELTGLHNNNGLAQYIYINNHYQLTPAMIDTIIEVFYEGKNKSNSKEKMRSAHLTTIKDLNLEPLNQYIDSNLETYLSNCFLAIDSNTQESESTVIELLNHYEIDEYLYKEILLKEEVIITDITSLEYECFWSILFDTNRVKPTWNNVLAFYKEEEWEKLEDE